MGPLIGAQPHRIGLVPIAPLGLEAWLMPLALEPTAPLATVCGVLATAARLPAEDKLVLLAEDNVVERARLLRQRLRTLGPVRQPPPSPGRN